MMQSMLTRRPARNLHIELFEPPEHGYRASDRVQGLAYVALDDSLIAEEVSLVLLGVVSTVSAQLYQDKPSSRVFLRMRRHLWPSEDTTAKARTRTASFASAASSSSSAISALMVGRNQRFSAQSDRSVMDEEQYYWPFTFSFPEVGQTLPSSVEAGQGFIRYELRLTIRRPFGHCDITEVVPIIFRETVDVASYPLRTPVQLRADNRPARISLGRRIFGNNSSAIPNKPKKPKRNATPPVQLWASLAHGGFRPGEQIPMVIEVHHHKAYFGADALTLSLERTFVYPAPRQLVSKCKIVSSRTVPLHITAEHGYRSAVALTLAVPPDTPPTSTVLTSVQVHYQLLIEARVDSQRRRNGKDRIILRTPITIGTVDTRSGANPPPVADEEEAAMRFHPHGQEGLPAYEAAVTGASRSLHTLPDYQSVMREL